MTDLTSLIRDLVRIDSVNPALDPARQGESELAHFVADWATARDLDVEWLEGTAGRPSVIVTARGSLERRTLPGESVAAVRHEVQQMLDRLAADDDTVTASITTLVTREPFEARAGSEIQRVLIEAIEAERGAKPALIGAPYWTDAALIAAAGIPTLLFGPTGGGIHQPDEWVDLESVNEMARVLDRVIGEFCA